LRMFLGARPEHICARHCTLIISPCSRIMPLSFVDRRYISELKCDLGMIRANRPYVNCVLLKLSKYSTTQSATLGRVLPSIQMLLIRRRLSTKGKLLRTRPKSRDRPSGALEPLHATLFSKSRISRPSSC